MIRRRIYPTAALLRMLAVTGAIAAKPNRILHLTVGLNADPYAAEMAGQLV